MFALGISPAELQGQVLSRAEKVPDGAIARLYLEGVDPEAYRLLDLEAVRDTARAGLFLKLEPQFASVANEAELPDLDAIGARWENYVENQDLTGLDRDRIRQLGLDYLDRAVESAG